MKITPMGNTPPAITPQTSAPNTEARARAMAALTGGNQGHQGHSVNSNQISPEEVSAVKAPESVDKSTQVAATNEETSEVVHAEGKVTEQSEQQTQETKAPEAKDPALERQFQELARQERILRNKAIKQTQELQAREEALKAREAQLAKQADEYKSGYVSKARLKAETLGVLAEEGLSYDQLTEQLLSHTPLDSRIEAKFRSFEERLAAKDAEIAAFKQEQDAKQTKQYQEAVQQVERDVKAFVAKNANDFEFIAKSGRHKDVVELIEQTYQQDGILLTTEEAAREVEDYLVEQTYKTVEKIEKIRKRLTPQPAVEKQVEQKTEAAKETKTQPAPMKTLTNASASTRQLTARERALLAFKGEKL